MKPVAAPVTAIELVVPGVPPVSRKSIVPPPATRAASEENATEEVPLPG